MSAGDVAQGGNENGHGQAGCECDGQQADATCAAQVKIHAYRARREKYQRECAQEFRA